MTFKFELGSISGLIAFITFVVILVFAIRRAMQEGKHTKEEEGLKEDEKIIIEKENIKISRHFLLGKLKATLTNFRLFIKREKNNSTLYILNLKENIHSEFPNHSIRNLSHDDYNFIFSKNKVTLNVIIEDQEGDYECIIKFDQLSPLQFNQLKKYYSTSNATLAQENIKLRKKEKKGLSIMSNNSSQKIYESGYCPECGLERNGEEERCLECTVNFFYYAKAQLVK